MISDLVTTDDAVHGPIGYTERTGMQPLDGVQSS